MTSAPRGLPEAGYRLGKARNENLNAARQEMNQMLELDSLTAEQQALLMLRILEKHSRQAVQEPQVPTIKPVPRNKDLPLSFAQQRLWFLDQLVPNNPFYNALDATRLTGPLDQAALHQALTEIVRRHEALRTTFTVVEGQPVQVIAPCSAVPLPLVDLSALPLATREVEVQRLATWEAHRPFNLEQGPLLRVTLLHLAVAEHVLLLTMHHIVSDDWSIGVLFRELGVLYPAFLAGHPSPLPELPIQYADFAVWQRDWLQGPVLEEQLAYWMKQLAGMPQSLGLLPDRTRPPQPTFRGLEEPFVLRLALTEALKTLSQREGVTLFMTLLAAFQTILYRYTGQEDLVIGAPIANRNRGEIEGLIGFFVNELLLRTNLSGDPTFRELLHQVREVTLEAYAHQDLPFEMIVEQLRPERDLSRSPLVQVFLAFENAPIESLELPDLTLSSQEFERRVSRYDLELHLRDESTIGLEGRLIYNSDIYEGTTIRRLLDHYRTLLEGIVSNPDSRLSNLPLLPVRERQQLLVEWNNGVTDNVRTECLAELFETQVARTPDAVAVVAPASPEAEMGVDQQLSYAELNARANQLARYLRKQGVRPNSIVAILEDRTLDMIIAILGVLKAGGAYLPIDLRNPLDRVLTLLEDSHTGILLTRDGLIKDIPFTRLKNLHDVSQDIVLTKPRSPIRDLDRLPYPDRGLVNYQKYNQHIGMAPVKNNITIYATRGCPYRCSYCHNLWPKEHAIRSAENVFREVEFHYARGYRSFTFVDDIFNLNRKNSETFFELVIKHNLKLRLLFPNGLRGDLLTPDYIDLMAEAGVTQMALALESASPRLQRLIRKNINLEKLQENLTYLCVKQPQIVVDLFAMLGFPTETKEEALLTLDFIKGIKWLHFPYIHILKVFPNTDMASLAMEHGVSKQAIERSSDLQFHEPGDTLPYSKQFVREYQGRFMSEYLLLAERLTCVIPIQKQAFTRAELLEKYNSLLPGKLANYPEIMNLLGTDGYRPEPLPPCAPETQPVGPLPFPRRRVQAGFPRSGPRLRVLLLDLSDRFSHEAIQVFNVVEAPLGLMYLMTYLNQELGARIEGKILKSLIDFDSFEELQSFLAEFQPQVIGLRTLSLHKNFFHRTISLIKRWCPDTLIIAGGPYATSEYATLLADQAVDVVVLGEGELTFTELLEKIIENNGRLPEDQVLEQIAGLAFIPRLCKAREKKGAPERQVLLLDKIAGEIAREEDCNLAQVNQAADLAYVIYTSGSTGVPKGVMINQANVAQLFAATQAQYQFCEQDIWSFFHSCAFDFSVWELWGALTYGGRLVLVSYWASRSPEAFYELLANERVTVLNQTPSAFRQLDQVEARAAQPHPLAVRWVIFGGEALDMQSLHAWFKRHGDRQPRLVNMYGITETTVHVTHYPLSASDLEQGPRSVIGRPIATWQAYLLDKKMHLVPVGVPGELYIGGAGLARGYLNRPDLTAERFIPNPFDQRPGTRLYKTGDRGRYLPTGKIEYLGRIDSQVKIRGHRIELGEIESVLRQHPLVRESVVTSLSTPSEEDGSETKRLIAYVTAEAQRTGEQPQEEEWKTEQIGAWQKLYDDVYSQPRSVEDVTFDTVGWESSYTRRPIPAQEMQEWIENAVGRILAMQPKRVLEIGCGTGLLLHRIAPHCTQYVGTDFSDPVLHALQRAVTERGLSQVKLVKRTANDFSGLTPSMFDGAILNSVIQYFPNVEYLLHVLEGVVDAVAEGGFVYVGDVRSRSLLEAFHLSVELARASSTLSVAELQHRVKGLAWEEELVVDPDFFYALKEHIPRISHVEIVPKRGRAQNELSKFRYEAILYIGWQVQYGSNDDWLDWEKNSLKLADVRHFLSEDKPEILKIRNVSNSRVLTEVAALKSLERLAGTATVGELVDGLPGMEGGVDPEDLWNLGEELEYEVELKWSQASARYDVVFRAPVRCAGQHEKISDFPPELHALKSWGEYTNYPLRRAWSRELMSQLRTFLKEKLPEYMIPAATVVLEALPLTPNGKVDQRALPQPEGERPDLADVYLGPQTPTEKILANIWAAVLKLKRVGVHDNFFELGGHSLLATQIMAQVREAFHVNLPLRVLFELPTVAGLASCIEATCKMIQASQAPVSGDYQEWKI